MKAEHKRVALIPARAGSKRLLNKNVKELEGHPLLAYSISAAISSGIFDEVVCVTDSSEYAEIATSYKATVPFLRPEQTASDIAPDITWVLWALQALSGIGKNFDQFSILRPTSPFRRAETIRRAMEEFSMNQPADSLRAVRKCSEHPGKMWRIKGREMVPILPNFIGEVPWHSSQYAALPEIYIQDASLEIAWVKTATEKRTISGDIVLPFISLGYEGFDINTADDWDMANKLISQGLAVLPEIVS
jgi:CMP-N,N'-diacetyllegionaminic acid synthase